ncbi:MAG: hypothetical protein ACYTGX_04325 [Planctomycetota bacterium]
MTETDGAKAFLLGRIHPAIWVACLGYFGPVAGSAFMVSGGDQRNQRIFALAFLSAAVLLAGGSFVALWRMRAHRRAHPAGPHYAGRLVALINIAMGIGAFIIFLAVPQGHGARDGNATAAIGALRSLVTAQEQFRQRALVDLDGDGMGEYGTLGELAGTDPLRGSGRTTAAAPFIAQILGVRETGTSFSRKNGYFFVLYLPSKEHGAVQAAPGSGSAPAVKADADLQETRWAAYAWPVEHGTTGARAFFVNQAGELLSCANRDGGYSGPATAPKPDAVFTPESPEAASLHGTLGIHEPDGPPVRSRDGRDWYPAGN